MSRLRPPRILPLLLALAAGVAPLRAAAPPLTVRDLALMARGGFSREEILAEAAKRRLALPLDEAAARSLRDAGMDPALVTRLQEPAFQLGEADAARAAAQAAANQEAARQRDAFETQLAESRRADSAELARRAAARQTMAKLLDGKLARLEGSEWKEYRAEELREVRLFAFYFACNWTPACRDTTRALIEWYKKIKPAHPEFELIFVSRDKSELTMDEHVRKVAMPFPVVRYASREDPAIQAFGGAPMPWLCAVSRSGMALTTNIETRQFIQPGHVQNAIEQMLGQLRAPEARLRGE